MAGETGPSSERGSGRPASARALGPALLPPRRAARERRTIVRHRGLMRLDAATAKKSKWLYFFFFFYITQFNGIHYNNKYQALQRGGVSLRTASRGGGVGPFFAFG